MSISIISDKKVWNKIKSTILTGNDQQVNIGFFPDSRYGPENENLPVAYVAAIQEEGSPPQNIPPRPFMRVGFGAPLRAGKYDKEFKRAIEDIVEGRSTFTQQYKLLGPVFVKDMKEAIIKWDTPRNSPMTIAEKGFDDPLRDSDTMLNSVDYKVEKKGSDT